MVVERVGIDVLALIFLPASPAFFPLPTMRTSRDPETAASSPPYSSNASLDRTLVPLHRRLKPLSGPDAQRERAERRERGAPGEYRSPYTRPCENLPTLRSCARSSGAFRRFPLPSVLLV
jgi:hypothetical protein